MLKKWLIIPLIVILFFVLGCERNEDEIIEILPEDLITMENLDEYMFRDDVQYVDLRNYEARFRTGFIYSFEIIPFFDYLDYRAFDRNDGYEFNPDQILSELELERLFDRDKAIFLYADGCIRSGYLMDVLIHMGYERIYILGGFYEYTGEHIVLGDGAYNIGDTFYNKHIDSNTNYTYYVFGNYDMGKKIIEIRFDILDEEFVSLRSPDYYPLMNYDQQLTTLEYYIISDIVTMNELYDALTNSGENSYDEIPGLTWEIDDGIIQLILGLKSQ